MKYYFLILFFVFSFDSFSQDTIAIQKQYYENAYNEINSMLEGKQQYSFKKAVFITENCFLNNKLKYEIFCNKIFNLSLRCSDFAKINYNNLIYEFDDKPNIIKYASVFKIMTDSIPLIKLDGKMLNNTPFVYDFEDIWGGKDWSKMFVSKLLETHKGNCHSLPFLYKIILEEMGEKAYLALAPNHIYIKLYSKKTGMYNTELTSAAFPIDAWLMASGYIHLDAIRSGIYMDTLNNQQSLSLCLLDLAKGYERKFGNNIDGYSAKCTETALKYYPNFINARLMKSEILKNNFDILMVKYKAKNPSDIFQFPEAKKMFDDYEKLIVQIHKLGYRKMPERMYLDWLLDLKEHQEKYTDKKIINTFKSSKPD
ncbi:MAG: hypothetical protein HY951_00640 [Bacteroidia bacterium]|nr:hypothetical protein [Bacteroidia bacterium]